MDQPPAEIRTRQMWFIGASALGGIGVLVAVYFDLPALLWTSFAVTIIAGIGLTVMNFVYTTRYLNKKSEHH